MPVRRRSAKSGAQTPAQEEGNGKNEAAKMVDKTNEH
jgi:hypothetical protein